MRRRPRPEIRPPRSAVRVLGKSAQCGTRSLVQENARGLLHRARASQERMKSAAGRYGIIEKVCRVGLWRSWERASMAWKRS